jgi:hypothetical protein
MGDLRDRSLRPSFREAISRAERQVERDAIVSDRVASPELVREICMIIAEVYMMDPSGPIRISGEWLDGHVVQQVFGELTREHVQMVAGEFCRLTNDIRNKKAYLRTALYNSVFSIEAHYTNRVNHDLRG